MVPSLGGAGGAAIFDGKIISPLTYGAKCDGVTNDDAAFASMVAALPSTPGQYTIKLPAGQCVKTTTLTVSLVAGQYLTIRGDSPYTSELRYDADADGIVINTADAQTNIVQMRNFSMFRNLPAVSKSTSGSTAAADTVIPIVSVSNITVGMSVIPDRQAGNCGSGPNSGTIVTAVNSSTNAITLNIPFGSAANAGCSLIFDAPAHTAITVNGQSLQAYGQQSPEDSVENVAVHGRMQNPITGGDMWLRGVYWHNVTNARMSGFTATWPSQALGTCVEVAGTVGSPNILSDDHHFALRCYGGKYGVYSASGDVEGIFVENSSLVGAQFPVWWEANTSPGFSDQLTITSSHLNGLIEAIHVKAISYLEVANTYIIHGSNAQYGTPLAAENVAINLNGVYNFSLTGVGIAEYGRQQSSITRSCGLSLTGYSVTTGGAISGMSMQANGTASPAFGVCIHSGADGIVMAASAFNGLTAMIGVDSNVGFVSNSSVGSGGITSSTGQGGSCAANVLNGTGVTGCNH